MANTQISATQLNERAGFIHVKGFVHYTRVTSRIEGAELKRRIEQSRSLYPKKTPHITITLSDASVLPISGDINNLTTEELYVQERRYSSSKPQEGETGLRYSIDAGIGENGTLPPIWVRKSNTPDENGNFHYTQLTEPEGELAKGTPVRLVLRVFRAGDNANRGLAIQGIYIEDDHVEYAVSRARSELAARGIILDAEPANQVPTSVGAQGVSAESSDANTDDDGLPMPSIGTNQNQAGQVPQTPQPAQVAANPAQPQQQNVAPAQSATVQQEVPAVAPQQNTQAQAAPAQPAQVAQPQQQTAPQQTAPSVFPQQPVANPNPGISYE